MVAAQDSLAAELGRDVPFAETADMLAQAIVCAAPILHGWQSAGGLSWLCESLSDWQRWVILQAEVVSGDPQYSRLSTEYSLSPANLYEPFLRHYAPASRERHGVYFTPEPIARYIVEQIDQLLAGDFGLSDGLATQSAIRNPQSEIVLLDPACGTGVFLLAVIDHLHRRLGDDWSDFVPGLLPRLIGVELLPVQAFLARLNITRKLAETGYDFREPGAISIHCTDALSPNPKSEIRNPKSTLPVILGNPPFSSLTTNTNPWIARLVRGDDAVRGYSRAGDLRLGERKTWLHDDYVKFLRLAQWHIDQAGRGIVGMVTSRGYLDNATFRLMRHELMRAFPRVRVVDLHGSRKAGETPPGGGRDENVFGLDQGVAIALLSCAGTKVGPPRVEYAELWGGRREKLAALASGGREPPECCVAESSLTFRVLDPATPHWRFVPSAGDSHPEYDGAWSLADAMPESTPAPVTARDHFVVAFTREQLHERIAEFRDLSIPDETIRQRYFTRTRSSRYPLGDTRSWKLAEARRAVAADDAWQSKIVRCLYRPFDWRYVFWHASMIDWPRTRVTRHLLPSDHSSSKFQVPGFRLNGTLNMEPGTWNLCLIARRQQLPAQPCTFFWVAGGLALDGVIRSDNRGSESLFPLWLAGEDGSPRANFAPEFLQQAAAAIGCQPSPEELLGYIYALFHSPTYRERYAPQLRADFPRVLLPRTDDLFSQLADFGRRLVQLHLLQKLEGPQHNCGGSRDGFRVGGYVVLNKWLQPKHRSAGDPQFESIAAAVAQTQQVMAEIDAAIDADGGFPAAFV